MRTNAVSAVTLGSILFLAAVQNPAAAGAALSLNLGTMGIGGEVALQLNGDLSARLGVDLLGIGRSDEMDGIAYELDASLAWVPLLLDYSPGGGAFRLSAGLVMNLNDVKLESSSTGSIEIGGHTYSSAQFGKLVADIGATGAAPYLGIGFGGRLPDKGSVSVAVDIGAMFQSYSVSLSHEGGNIPASLEEQFLGDLEEESRTVEDELNGSFGVYPVVRLGVGIGL